MSDIKSYTFARYEYMVSDWFFTDKSEKVVFDFRPAYLSTNIKVNVIEYDNFDFFNLMEALGGIQSIFFLLISYIVVPYNRSCYDLE